MDALAPFIPPVFHFFQEQLCDKFMVIKILFFYFHLAVLSSGIQIQGSFLTTNNIPTKRHYPLQPSAIFDIRQAAYDHYVGYRIYQVGKSRSQLIDQADVVAGNVQRISRRTIIGIYGSLALDEHIGRFIRGLHLPASAEQKSDLEHSGADPARKWMMVSMIFASFMTTMMPPAIPAIRAPPRHTFDAFHKLGHIFITCSSPLSELPQWTWR